MMVFLATAAVVVPLVNRIKVSPVLGFLARRHCCSGPTRSARSLSSYPALDWVAVTDAEKLSLFGELGIVFLLFLVGLELPDPAPRHHAQAGVRPRRRPGRPARPCVIGAAASLFGAEPGAATVIGLSLALSSTAIVVEVLSQQQRLRTATGRTTFSILLLQDLAVVPLLLLVTILRPGGEGSVFTSIALALRAGLARHRLHRRRRHRAAAALVPPRRPRARTSSCSSPRRCWWRSAAAC